MPCPQAEWEWEEISQQFEERWQLPNCVGAGDGKHIRIKCPRNSYSRYFNYKGYFSIVLMAFVGPRYEFFLLMQDAREVQVTEGYLGPRNCGRP